MDSGRSFTCRSWASLEPLAAYRVVLTSKHRTKADGAECGREVIDEHYPDGSVMVLVMDNLNIYRLSSLHEALSPRRRLSTGSSRPTTPASSSNGLYPQD
jgi:hypothetical protein